jgi:hypothetical protein
MTTIRPELPVDFQGIPRAGLFSRQRIGAEAAFDQILSEHGLERDRNETPSFSSIQALGLPPASIERLRGVLRVWVMTTGRLPGGPAT